MGSDRPKPVLDRDRNWDQNWFVTIPNPKPYRNKALIYTETETETETETKTLLLKARDSVIKLLWHFFLQNFDTIFASFDPFLGH